MNSIQETRAALEAEGVHIGGWSLKQAFVRSKASPVDDGVHQPEQNEAFIDWSVAEERALVRKLDFRVLFPCCILYFLAYLDRANMGFVNVLQKGTPDNFSESLHLHGTDFNWAVSITYFMTTVLLLPSNLLMKTISGKNYFPIIMVGFGTVVCCLGAVQNRAGLFAARFFLGVPEAGVVPACLMYFSFWYKPEERALRFGIFYAANSLATGLGGFIANGVDDLDGKGGLPSWRWLFIIEGLMSIAMAPVVYFLLLTFPETTTAFNERERHIAINRFGRGSTRQTDATWDTRAVLQVLSRPSTYVFFVSYICLLIVAVSLGTFLPIILTNFAGFSSTQSNEYTSAVYLVAIPIYAFWSWHSDHARERMWHYLLPVLGAIPCFAVWTYVAAHRSLEGLKPITLYGLAFLGNLVSIAQPAALSYRSSTLYGAAEQAVGGATAVAALSISSIIGPQIYRTSESPWYLSGFSTSCGTLAFTVIGFASLPLWFFLEARQRKKNTGHALPLRALDDALQAQVSDAVRTQANLQTAMEEKVDLEREAANQAEHVETMEMNEPEQASESTPPLLFSGNGTRASADASPLASSTIDRFHNSSFLCRTAILGQDFHDIDHANGGTTARNPEHTLSSTDLETLKLHNAFELPDYPERQSLIDVFFDKCWAFMPVVDRLGLDPTETDSPISYLLLQAVLLAGRNMRPHRYPASMTEVLYRRLKALVYSGHERSPLDLVAALCLIQWSTAVAPKDITQDSPRYWTTMAVDAFGGPSVPATICRRQHMEGHGSSTPLIATNLP
ncbi:hypothetical protein M409DRAFT_24725 [Zasmidium cellare ATCC 36951]|uniref:Major facilitator superfamily (MFS) profile domain-containing protein n=1 Tax=Zasmidium cellare ATCC 36951 TaxID=1080233 RepID=A0A6A6CEZ0_ZASCE|nr:uncharacterized protein M409DRAFT_24725 [Zasmidium cellare ATCC 36951]KAF2164820.1 hypothetical protein M409DRAFT_24725 [Zasmidium cellare ATCC 36951]